MRWILDACTLIYLVKAKLFSKFIALAEHPVVIDSSVYKEVVTDGKANNYPDASDAEVSLNKFKIPVISIDITRDYYRFRDFGETSCYILTKEDGICLTSDDRAYKKFKNEDQKVIRMDSFYFEKLNQNMITEKEFIEILKKLESINATKPKSILFFLENIEQNKKVKDND
jgi:hypothetical protein